MDFSRVAKQTLSVFLFTALTSSFFVSPATAVSNSALPLVQKNDLVYQGAFTVPDGTFGKSNFNYGGTSIAFNPNNNSLFIVGHDWDQDVAEINIPALKTSSKASDLNNATVLQNFSDPTDGKMYNVDENTIKVGGLLVSANSLINSAYSYYDGDANQSLSHVVTSLTLNKSGDSSGPYKVGSVGAGFVSGYMANIPSSWQGDFGATAMTGQCCIAIVSRTSYGPAVFAFNPTDVGNKNPVPATPLVYYDEKHPTLGEWSGDSTQFNGNTQIRGLVFPTNTRSVLFIGSQGMGKFCYGTGTECGDKANDSKGVHGYPYAYQIWAYDANDLLSVKNGQKQPWEIRPYTTWNFDLPYAGTNDNHQLGGAAYDSATGRIFVSQMYGNGTRPVIHVFKLAGATGTSPAPSPITPTTPPPAPAPAQRPSPVTPVTAVTPAPTYNPTVNLSVTCPAYTNSVAYRSRARTVVMGPNDKWINAIQTAKAGTDVVLKDGTYELGSTYTVYIPDDVTVRAQSGDRNKVIIKGRGYAYGSEGLTIKGKNAVIADVTITGMRDHGIAIKGEMGASEPRIYNVNLYNIGTQMIKLTPKNTAAGTPNGLIACSSIGYTPGGVKGSYINGIDLHNAVNWIIRDNYLYNIYGDGSGCNVDKDCKKYTAGGGPAILVWNKSKGTTVERNTIVDSFFGISLGHGTGHEGGIVKNNFIYRTQPGDTGIALQSAKNTEVSHNTVRIAGYQGAIEARDSSGIKVYNNLMNVSIWNRDGKSINALGGNIDTATDSDFLTPNKPSLKAGSKAIGAGIVLTTVTDDIDGRPRNNRFDVGASGYLGVVTTPTPTTPNPSNPTTPSPTTPAPIPTPTTAPVEPAKSCKGLTGTYYNNTNFTSRMLSRIDSYIHFDWQGTAPAAKVEADTFSVRWTGYVIPKYSETYTFSTISDDGVRLWVNGQQLINNWTLHAATENSGKITLKAGKKYKIQLDFFEQQWAAVIKLFWSSPSQIKEIIPAAQLAPLASCKR